MLLLGVQKIDRIEYKRVCRGVLGREAGLGQYGEEGIGFEKRNKKGERMYVSLLSDSDATIIEDQFKEKAEA